MEEHAHDNCRIVYFCSSAPHAIQELHHKKSPPDIPAGASSETAAIYRNARALLDENQGDFDEVFLCSSPQPCLDRIESLANSDPTIVLIEVHNSNTALKDESNASFSFLRSLSNDIHGARFQKHVMPFVLAVLGHGQQPDADLDQEVTNSCLQAGALDILRTPLSHDDINRMIGHFKDKNRPPAHLLGAPMAQSLVDSIHDVCKPPRLEVYRPDEELTADRKKAVERAVGQWRFPAQDFNMDQLTYAALFMLEHVLKSAELKDYRLERRQLVAFLLATRRQYKHECEVHYHNWRHAVDVSQSIFCFLLELQLCPPIHSDGQRSPQTTPLEQLLTPLDGLILLVSAIGHDVGHPGVNNAFLVACNHPLAQMYNDKSVLENYHCAAYQQLLRRHWPSLNRIAGFRSTMISTILATDMQRHFDYMSHLSELSTKAGKGQANPSEWEEKERESTRELIMALLIKAADISNVARPFDVAAKWARILMYEFARQGELESEMEIPTCLFGGPPDTEDMLAAAQSQKGFLSLFGVPLFQGVARVLPSMTSAVRELERNQVLWEDKINEEKKRRDDTEVERPHLGSVTQDDVDEAQLEHSKSEPTAVPIDATQSISTPTKRTLPEHSDTPLSKHGDQGSKQQSLWRPSFEQEKRASTNMLPLPALFPPAHATSRRSSKDVALEQLQQLGVYAHQTVSSGSRRASADAGMQVHQSYPGSRRGSKDESLTTIFVASGSANARHSSSSAAASKKSSPSKSSGKKNGSVSGIKSPTERASAQPTSPPMIGTEPALATTLSPPLPPSTLPADQGDFPAEHFGSIPSTEDPFLVPSSWPNDVDGTHRSSMQTGPSDELPSTPPPPPQLGIAKVESTHTTLTEADTHDVALRAEGPGLRQARSRSRLRGLKFWKRRRDAPDIDIRAPQIDSP